MGPSAVSLNINRLVPVDRHLDEAAHCCLVWILGSPAAKQVFLSSWGLCRCRLLSLMLVSMTQLKCSSETCTKSAGHSHHHLHLHRWIPSCLHLGHSNQHYHQHLHQQNVHHFLHLHLQYCWLVSSSWICLQAHWRLESSHECANRYTAIALVTNHSAGDLIAWPKFPIEAGWHWDIRWLWDHECKRSSDNPNLAAADNIYQLCRWACKYQWVLLIYWFNR